jgi:intracellular multiplication protein IcmC
MLLKKTQNPFKQFCLRFSFLFFLLLCSIPVYAADTKVSGLSAMDMLINISKQVPQLMRLITAIAYVLGMYFIINGIISLKHLGESRTMMSQEHSLTGPLVYIMVGSLLLYLPSSVQLGMNTFWTSPCPYCYAVSGDQWTQFLSICYTVVQLFGVVAFIRGLVTLTHLGGRGGGAPDTLAKGLTYIIAGIFCINIYQFVQVILFTLGVKIGA